MGAHPASSSAIMGSTELDLQKCPYTAPFFGFMGAAGALVFANFGAAYGTAKSGVGVASMGVMRPDRDPRYHSRRHGWSDRYLRSYHCGHRLLVCQGWRLPSLQRIRTSCWWSCWWSFWSRRRYGDWHRRRCWCPCVCTAAASVRRCDPHSHFRRGSWSVRSHCRADHVQQERRLRLQPEEGVNSPQDTGSFKDIVGLHYLDTGRSRRRALWLCSVCYQFSECYRKK